MTSAQAIKIVIAAMGGQGGGVLANWIVKLGEQSGFVAQATSVPGVAQRTGATIYYVELFPLEAMQRAGKAPVLALTPAPGDVDIVLAAELMETGRALKRGFVAKKTTLIASTHRDYAIDEKIAPGDGRRDAERVRAALADAAGALIEGDMAAAASKAGAPISAVLFGALAGSEAVPIERGQFEHVIQELGRAVAANLEAFALGYELAKVRPNAPDKRADRPVVESSGATRATAALINRVKTELPAEAHFFAREGLMRAVDFQDAKYADLYLDRLRLVAERDREAGGNRRGYALSLAVAKHLAVWMTYEDSIRVADLKTRRSRFARFRKDVRAEADQIVDIREYLHPRVEEFCDLLPTPMAKAVLGTPALRSAVRFALGPGRRVTTTKLRGFLPLYVLASLRFMRRAGSRYAREQQRINVWLSTILSELDVDYDFAVETAKLQRLIKGYGETHERGVLNFNLILAVLPRIKTLTDPAEALRGLANAALKDEEGAALQKALGALPEREMSPAK